MRNWNEKYSLVRFFHAVPDGEEVDVYINESLFFRGVSFTDFTPYIYVPKGQYEIEIYLKDTKEKPILQQEMDILTNDLTTLAFNGELNDLNVLQIKEDTEMAPGSISKVRVVHLVPNGRTVNISVDEKMVFEDVKFRYISNYAQLPPKVYDVEITDTASNKVIRESKITINPNRIYTFYAVGKLPNIQFIQSLDGATFIF